MEIVIIGNGLLGRTVEAVLAEQGVAARMLSRSSGFDVTEDTAFTQVGAADAIIETTGITTTSARVAAEFFARSTTTVSLAARAAGARHVLVSIIGCDKPEVQGFGYYRGKHVQEQLARAKSPDLSLVRSTQWHEFAGQTLRRFAFGPAGMVPLMQVQPVAAREVALVAVECALAAGPEPLREVAGPEVTTVLRMARALPERPGFVLPMPLPGTYGRAFRSGALLAGETAEIRGPSFGEWLAAG